MNQYVGEAICYSRRDMLRLCALKEPRNHHCSVEPGAVVEAIESSQTEGSGDGDSDGEGDDESGGEGGDDGEPPIQWLELLLVIFLPILLLCVLTALSRLFESLAHYDTPLFSPYGALGGLLRCICLCKRRGIRHRTFLRLCLVNVIGGGILAPPMASIVVQFSPATTGFLVGLIWQPLLRFVTKKWRLLAEAYN